MFVKPIIYTFLYLYLVKDVQGYINLAFPCITPNGEAAYCVSIFSCPPLMKALGSLDRSAIDFVQKSVCCGCIPGDMLVCCGTKYNFLDTSNYKNVTIQRPTSTKPTTTTTQRTHSTIPSTTTTQSTIPSTQSTIPSRTTIPSTTTTQSPIASTTTTPTSKQPKRDVLPSRSYCGFQHTDDRLYRDNVTALDEFPWLVHVIYLEEEDDEEDMYLDRCNGVLISDRYVLTSESCASDVTKIRLGQYNTDKNVSCIENPDTPECSEPWIDVVVEKRIHRQDYSKDIYSKAHNFVLLRLKESVTFSDFIRPICLPLEESERPSANQSYYFSGWGAADRYMIEKKRLAFNLTSTDDCHKLDAMLKNDSVDISLMCLKPDSKNSDSACQGDEAGPLMYSYNHQWFAEGIVMNVYFDDFGAGVNRCSKTFPIAVARISPEVIDWIVDVIESNQ